MFFAMQKTDFHLLSFFEEKVILELIAQNHFCIASENTNSVFSANYEIAKATGCSKLLFSVRKVAKCNFKMQSSKHEKCFFLMK